MIKLKSSGIDVVILAGGFGTRIRHIIGSVPKPLVLVHGKPFLYWLFLNLSKYTINNIFLLTHYASNLIENYISDLIHTSFEIKCIRETLPLGTGGSVSAFLAKGPELTNPFLLMNGDSLLVDFDLDFAINKIHDGYDAVIFGVLAKDTSRYGTLEFDENMTLTGFLEKKTGIGAINSGVYLLSPSLFSNFFCCNEFISLEKEIIPAMISAGKKFFVLLQEKPFIDIGTEKTLAEADIFLRENFPSTKFNASLIK